MAEQNIDVADHVLHGPTGEEWVVARVDDTHLWWAGWPPGRANLSDCTLTYKATAAQREGLLRDLGKLPPDDERRLTRGMENA